VYSLRALGAVQIAWRGFKSDAVRWQAMWIGEHAVVGAKVRVFYKTIVKKVQLFANGGNYLRMLLKRSEQAGRPRLLGANDDQRRSGMVTEAGRHFSQSKASPYSA
jgi:hypothetical protein